MREPRHIRGGGSPEWPRLTQAGARQARSAGRPDRRPLVAVDALAVVPNRRGLGRFQARLLAELATVAADVLDVVALVAPGVDAADLALAPRWSARTVRASNDLARSATAVPRALRRLRADVYLTTTDRLRAPRGLPVLLYVFEHPAYRTRVRQLAGNRSRRSVLAEGVTTRWFRHTLRRADRIVTASTSTARDLVFFEGLAPQTVSVAMPGPLQRVEERSAHTVPEPSVLVFIDRDPRDNARTVLEAFAQVGEPWVLDVVGDPPPAVAADAACLGIESRVRFHGRIDDEQLARLRDRASVFLDASLYEGFGAGTAEAVATGVPAIVSAVTSLPEVTAGRAGYVNPHDVAAVSSALRALTADPQALARATDDARATAPALATNWPELAEHLTSLCVDLAART